MSMDSFDFPPSGANGEATGVFPLVLPSAADVAHHWRTVGSRAKHYREFTDPEKAWRMAVREIELEEGQKI